MHDFRNTFRHARQFRACTSDQTAHGVRDNYHLLTLDVLRVIFNDYFFYSLSQSLRSVII